MILTGPSANVGADDYTWTAASIGSQNAAGYQLATQRPVMAIGGFKGSDPRGRAFPGSGTTYGTGKSTISWAPETAAGRAERRERRPQ